MQDPHYGWLTMENLIKIDDLGVALFQETTAYIYLSIYLPIYLVYMYRQIVYIRVHYDMSANMCIPVNVCEFQAYNHLKAEDMMIYNGNV